MDRVSLGRYGLFKCREKILTSYSCVLGLMALIAENKLMQNNVGNVIDKGRFVF